MLPKVLVLGCVKHGSLFFLRYIVTYIGMNFFWLQSKEDSTKSFFYDTVIAPFYLSYSTRSFLKSIKKRSLIPEILYLNVT